MSDARLSRRSILPTLATGAAVAALGAEVQAEGERRYIGTAGPATLSAGNILVVEGALPPLTQTKSDPMQFKMVLQTLDGRILGQAYPKLAVGSPGFSYRLFCMGDGSVRFGERALEFAIRPGTSRGIIAILIGLLLPAVQSPTASVQGLKMLPEGGDGEVNYILPFIEQQA